MLTFAGLQFLESAVAEAQSADQGSQALARQLYIHSLAYLLQGLPPQLSDAEVISLQSAIPTSLERRDGLWAREDGSGKHRPPSLLHEILAMTIIQLFHLLALIFPYVRTFLRSAYWYERENHILEKTFSAAFNVVDCVGQRSCGVAATILDSSDGRVRSMLVATLSWWVDGIAGGIHEGVSEGIVILGIRKRASDQPNQG